MVNKSSSKPLPLNDTLRDLAVYRASDVDLSSLLSHHRNDNTNRPEDFESSVERSYEFLREARAVMNIHKRGIIETEGEKVEHVRGELESALKGLQQD